MEKDVVLETKDLVKEYRLGQIDTGTLRGDLQSFFARLFKKDDPNIPLIADQYYDVKHKTHRALDGVSISIKRGEAIGLIGANGAGKSTLLKLISRITLPTEGSLSYRGKVASLLEVGTGFNGELTGRENIYMNGAILGMTKAQIEERIEQIIAFSEIGEYIDTPVKRYSSGMFVKLAFAVAAHLDADILLMDEILAVGDVKFQDKSLRRMEEVANEEHKTVIYVSHNMTTIRRFCSRCIVLEEGKVVYDGEVEEAIEVYTRRKKLHYSTQNDVSEAPRRYCPNRLMRKVSFTECNLPAQTDCVVRDLNNLHLQFKLIAKEPIENARLKVTFRDSLEQPVASSVSPPLNVSEGESTVDVFADIAAMKQGSYTVGAALMQVSSFDIFSNYDNVEQMCFIDINPDDSGLLWAVRTWGKIALPPLRIGGERLE
ncbi:MAG: ATP-binding cassette domain-containing protein [Clostridia bacterium]|nr:ATP-binding cassette domain-containing protein [Clostridia bacterium]